MGGAAVPPWEEKQAMTEVKPYWQTLPDGFQVIPIPKDGKTYITYNGRFVVTKETGSPKFFKGTDEAVIIKASKWIYSFRDGYQDKYEIHGSLRWKV